MRSWQRACGAFVVVLLAVTASPADKPEDAGQTAAESWLKLVDGGNYGDSWDQAAKLFRDAITKEKWIQAAGSARGPLGKVVSRKLKSRDYAEHVPGAPDGKYVSVRFDTVFEHKASAVETVTPMVDPDGVWRVSGYFVR